MERGERKRVCVIVDWECEQRCEEERKESRGNDKVGDEITVCSGE